MQNNCSTVFWFCKVTAKKYALKLLTNLKKSYIINLIQRFGDVSKQENTVLLFWCAFFMSKKGEWVCLMLQ